MLDARAHGDADAGRRGRGPAGPVPQAEALIRVLAAVAGILAASLEMSGSEVQEKPRRRNQPRPQHLTISPLVFSRGRESAGG